MEFLNVGSGELLFLILLAILVVGPKRAVELARQAGRLAARLGQEWRSVQRELMVEIQALEQDVLSDGPSPLPPGGMEADADRAG